jgi:adenosylcobinamide-GDP ribazoletransferase
MVVAPIIITGGIHMDGFLDTQDALSSYQPRERRLEILKDSHAGAFAIQGLLQYIREKEVLLWIY